MEVKRLDYLYNYNYINNLPYYYTNFDPSRRTNLLRYVCYDCYVFNLNYLILRQLANIRTVLRIGVWNGKDYAEGADPGTAYLSCANRW